MVQRLLCHKNKLKFTLKLKLILKNRYKKFIKDVVSGTIERREYLEELIEKHLSDDINLKRIADALEEILRLVKADQERSQKYMEEKNGGLKLIQMQLLR